MYSCYGGVYDVAYTSVGSEYATQMMDYWQRSLFQRLSTLFIFKDLPEEWDREAFIYALYRRGFLVGFISKTYGKVIQHGTPSGYGLQYQPTHMQVNSPYFNFPKPLQIGTECELIKLTPDYRGVWDIIIKYADELRYIDTAVRQSSISARSAMAFIAKDDKSARALKKVQQEIANGEPAITVHKDLATNLDGEIELPWVEFDRDLKNNFILPELLEARRTSLRDFYREIGVRLNEDKKERQIVSEVSAQEAETYIRREVWLGCLERSLEKFNAFMGTNITVEINEPEPEEVETDAE